MSPLPKIKTKNSIFDRPPSPVRPSDDDSADDGVAARRLEASQSTLKRLTPDENKLDISKDGSKDSSDVISPTRHLLTSPLLVPLEREFKVVLPQSCSPSVPLALCAESPFYAFGENPQQIHNVEQPQSPQCEALKTLASGISGSQIVIRFSKIEGGDSGGRTRTCLGEGQSSTVYKAFCGSARSDSPEWVPCALKVPNRLDAEAVMSALREAALLSYCRHPNIIHAAALVDLEVEGVLFDHKRGESSSEAPPNELCASKAEEDAAGEDIDVCNESFTRVTLEMLPVNPPELLLHSSLVCIAPSARNSYYEINPQRNGNGESEPPLEQDTDTEERHVPEESFSSGRAVTRGPEYALVLELCVHGTLWDYVIGRRSDSQNTAESKMAIEFDELVLVNDQGGGSIEGPKNNKRRQSTGDGSAKGNNQAPVPVSSRQWHEWAQKLTAAVAHMHGLGVVHHDVKPQNVLLDANLEPKLSDFGVAAAVPECGYFTQGQGLGTLAYMAPEMAEGQQYTASVDVYALAATLYVVGMLGRAPFCGVNNPVMLLMAVTRGFLNHQRNTRETDVWKYLSGEPVEKGVVSELRRALSKDSEQRPTAREFSNRLEEIRQAQQ